MVSAGIEDVFIMRTNYKTKSLTGGQDYEGNYMQLFQKKPEGYLIVFDLFTMVPAAPK